MSGFQFLEILEAAVWK